MLASFDIAPGMKVGGGAPLLLIAGPCALESESLAQRVCEEVREICARTGIPFIFKSSYDKANRQNIGSFRGPGLEKGLRILEKIRDKQEVPVLTDVHSPEDARAAGDVVDVLQIPAFLCRQTDLAIACGKTKKPVLVKKGQFMAPEDMLSTVVKIKSGGSERVLLGERGTTFGYHDLVVDMRSLVKMRNLDCPVVFDCTHAVQQPGAGSGASGGTPSYIEPLARAAVAAGVDALFAETHPDCDNALCDAATMLPLNRLEPMLKRLKEIDSLVKS